jgi:ADP-heptose:LPS heptosyltransferase
MAALRFSFRRRARPASPRRILIAHHLLLGDTLMLTALLAKLRARYPQAEIVMTVRPEFASLYMHRPYDITALPYDPKSPASLRALQKSASYDLALIPGDNRYSWLARALDARWVVAFSGDRPAYKNWPADELIPFPQTPLTVADMMALLADGPPPAPYRPADWPLPEAASLDLPAQPYCVLHVGAGNSLRRWQADNWRALIASLEQRGLRCVFSGAASDHEHIRDIDPDGARRSYAGETTLPQLCHLLKNAALLVCPDTGIAHLGRIVGVPTVALFGQGSPLLFGAGEFWRDSLFQAVWVENFHCRDQKALFKREANWIRRCNRSPKQCASAECMKAIDVRSVLDAADRLLNNARP